MKQTIKLSKAIISIAFVIVMCRVWYLEGREDGERGLGYWAGWQDAMTEMQSR